MCELEGETYKNKKTANAIKYFTVSGIADMSNIPDVVYEHS
jgi:hypothetical protein